MITLAVATTWIAISIVGAKGLTLFARAAAPGTYEGDNLPGDDEGGSNRNDVGRGMQFRTCSHVRGAWQSGPISGNPTK
jgi:hypothetical protein